MTLAELKKKAENGVATIKSVVGDPLLNGKGRTEPTHRFRLFKHSDSVWAGEKTIFTEVWDTVEAPWPKDQLPTDAKQVSKATGTTLDELREKAQRIRSGFRPAVFRSLNLQGQL